MAYKYNPFTGNIDLDGGAGGGGWDGTTALDVTVAGVASTPPVKFSGSWFTGGTATTTKPQFLIEPAGTTSTAWSTAGTGLGVNAPSGFTGRVIDLTLNASPRFAVHGNGAVNILGNANGSATVHGWTVLPGLTPSSASVLILGETGSYNNSIGNSRIQFNAGEIRVGVNNAFSWGDTGSNGSSTLSLFRDANDALAQRRGANAQVWRIYNTFTSATNHERGKLEWASSIFNVGTEKGSGGGTARPMALQTDGADRLKLDTVGSVEVATALTVATLPTSPAVGMIARVTDADAPAIGSTVAGGGAANALVWYNGANWTVLNTVAQTLVQSDTTGIAGADAVTNIVSLTQAEYDAIGAPSATTLYVITA